jgi:hypothetical protein
VAVEIKLSEGTILRTGKQNARPEDYTSKLVAHRTYVPITTEDGRTYLVNPEQVVYLRAVE